MCIIISPWWFSPDHESVLDATRLDGLAQLADGTGHAQGVADRGTHGTSK